MTDEPIDAIMQKACSTPQGQLKASFLLSDLEKLAPVYADPATRSHAEAALDAWQASADPLRKGMALAWLARAKAALAGAGRGAAAAVAEKTGASAAAGAVKTGYARAAGKAGDLGAAAGEKLAQSPLNRKAMEASRQKGGLKAQARLGDRLNQNAPAHAAPAPRQQMQAAPSPRLTAPAVTAAPAASSHADALAAAFRSGAEHAASTHASAAARHGRVAAKYAFKAGVQMTAVGAGVAAAGTAARVGNSLSEAQHEERVNAGKASHHGAGQLGKSVGSALTGAAQAVTGAVRAHGYEAALGLGVTAAVAATPSLLGDTSPHKAAGSGLAPHVEKLKAMNTPKTPKAPGS